MGKYVRVLLTAGWSVLFGYPKMLYYSRHKDKIPYDKRRAYAEKLYRKVSKAFRIEYNIIGLEKVPEEPVLFVSNHQSYYDPIMSYMFNRPIIYVAKKEIKKLPFAGRVATFVDSIYIDREDLRSALEIIKKASMKIKEGKSVWIFPEGTRTRHKDHSMNEFKAGSFKVAYNTKATIVPVAINGTWKVLDKKHQPKKHHIDIEFMTPIKYDDYKDMTTIELSEKLHKQVEDKFLAFASQSKD